MISSGKDDEGSATMGGLEFGAFEYAVIKTVHLGLCQAAGYAVAVAMYTPICGENSQLVWTLAVCWILSIPVGFTLYLIYKLTISKQEKAIKFSRRKHAGSWSAYLSRIYQARSSPDRFCKPHIVHYLIKIFLALCGALFVFVAISFVSEPGSSIARIVLLFVFGFICLALAATLSLSPGRKLVVSLTNMMASCIGKEFVMEEGGGIIENHVEISNLNTCVSRISFFLISTFVSTGSWIQGKVEAMLDPDNLWDLSHRGKWVKKDALKSFYSDLSDRGIYFAVFQIIKNVIIGITLADSPTLVSDIPKAYSKIHLFNFMYGLLICFFLQAWVVAVLYIVELLILTFYSPDVDVINGLKLALQGALQTIVIIAAALVTSGQMQSNYGEQLCIQVSLVQVFLAIPEQIWGVVSKIVLRKSGPPREPDFKTTDEELKVDKERSAVPLTKKFKAAGTVLKSVKSMKPVLKKGEPKQILVEIVSQKQLLLSIEMLDISGLSILFEDIFRCEAVRNALKSEMSVNPEISAAAQALLANKWHTSVDIRNGLFQIYSIKDILEGSTNRSKPVGHANVTVHGMLFGSVLGQHNSIISSGHYGITVSPIPPPFPYQQPASQSLPTPFQPILNGQQLLQGPVVVSTSPFFHPSSSFPYFPPQQSAQIAQIPPILGYPELVFYHLPQGFGMYGFAGGNTSPLSSSVLESDNEGSDDDFSRSSDSPRIKVQVTPSPDISDSSALHSAFSAGQRPTITKQILTVPKEQLSSTKKQDHVTVPPISADFSDLFIQNNSILEVGRQGALYGTDSNTNIDMKVKANHDEGTNTFDLTTIGKVAEKEPKQVAEETQPEKNIASSYKEEASAATESSRVSGHLVLSKAESINESQLFKAFLSRIFGAIDSETLDTINEKLVSTLPDALAELMDDVPGAEILDTAAAVVELEADGDSEEGEEEDGRLENEGKQKNEKKSEAREANKDGVQLAGVSFGFLHQQPQKPLSEENPTQLRSYSTRQVVYFLGWLPWDWIFFWISATLALVSLFVLTALANTTCSCTT